MSKAMVSAKVGRYLAGLAHRLKGNPDFMAYVLSVYQTQECLDDRALAEHLRTTVEMLPRLALCKRPSTESARFADQVRQIAAYVSTDPAVVANVIRQVGSLEALARRPVVLDSDEQPTRQPYTEAGLLAAARDRSEADSDQSPSPEQESSRED
jgi:hypothetical protein